MSRGIGMQHDKTARKLCNNSNWDLKGAFLNKIEQNRIKKHAIEAESNRIE